MLKVNISKGENMKVPNLPSSTAGECSQFSRQVFPLSLPVSVFTLVVFHHAWSSLMPQLHTAVVYQHHCHRSPSKTELVSVNDNVVQ